jgi:hypothetical protein
MILCSKDVIRAILRKLSEIIELIMCFFLFSGRQKDKIFMTVENVSHVEQNFIGSIFDDRFLHTGR